MKIILAGSPEISVPAFKEIIKNFEVVAIITNPDRKSGRGMRMKQTPVASLAEENSILTFKPNKISEIYLKLQNMEFDLLLSFAFGQYIPEKILSLGKNKPLNIHGSLLPKYRGAAPIHYAILKGDKKIGITLWRWLKRWMLAICILMQNKILMKPQQLVKVLRLFLNWQKKISLID